MARFNGTELTEESMQATRQWFHDNALACIEEAKDRKGTDFDFEGYAAWRRQAAQDSLDGKGDHTVAFLQRAYFIQTGESVALLP